MGSGSWSAVNYSASRDARRSAGKSDFDYGDTMKTRLPSSSWAVHENLDPAKVNAAGEVIREALDTDEHPLSTPIAVLFDVTGSMGLVPRELVKKLPELYGLILRKGYVADPQILFGGIGDATCDRVPLQLGQFESDNRADDDLGNIVLEGGGGGQTTESYELAMYFMARHTRLDSLNKRGKRGYLFIIGDEQCYPAVDSLQVKSFIGNDLGETITTAAICQELQEQFDVYLIRPSGAGASYPRGGTAGDRIFNDWARLLGQQIIEVDDLGQVCETIALMVGLAEGVLDSVDDGIADLHEIGAGDAAPTVSKALAHVGSGRGSVVTTDDLPDLDGTDDV